MRETWTFGGKIDGDRTVTVRVGEQFVGRLCRRGGGVWELDEDGKPGLQLWPVRVPLGHGFEAWARRHLAAIVRELQRE